MGRPKSVAANTFRHLREPGTPPGCVAGRRKWDLCRLAASAVLVARDRKMDTQQQDGAAGAVCAAYAETPAKLGRGPLVDRWYRMTRWESLDSAEIALAGGDDDDLLRRAAELINREDVREQSDTLKKLMDGSGRFNEDKKERAGRLFQLVLSSCLTLDSRTLATRDRWHEQPGLSGRACRDLLSSSAALVRAGV